MGEQVLRLVVGLIVSIWTARHLGPLDFGQLSYATAYASLFGVVATLGLNRILVRELVGAKDDMCAIVSLMSTTLAMRMLMALLMYGAAVLGAWLTDDTSLLLIALIAGGFVFSASDCVDLYFQARVQSRHVVQARVIVFLISTLLRVGLLYAKAGVAAFAAVTLLEFALSALMLQLAYARHGSGFQYRQVSLQTARTLLRECAPEILAALAGLMFMRLDQVMLQHLAGAQSVGTFAVAARLSELWYFIPVSIVASTFPNIIAMRDIDRAVCLQRLQMLTTALVGLSYIVVLLAALVVAPLIPVLYGKAYAAAADILVIQIWCGVFLVFAQTSGAWIMAEKMARLNLYRSLLGMTVNIICNLWLIPIYGARGASVATLLSFVFAYLIFDFFVPSLRSIGWIKLRALLIVPGWRRVQL